MTAPALKTASVILTTLWLSACSSGSDETASRDPFAGLSDGWNHIAAHDETACADDSDFSFWFHPADPERVVVYFQGGGACWAGELCALDRNPTYDPSVDESDAPGNEGIFDRNNPDNPVGTWSVLFIPYCTGDVHLGTQTATYDVEANDSLPARTFEIRHEGVRNVEAALAWMYERITDPDVVLVTGVSAGAIGSAYHAPTVAEHYPQARVVQIGDAAGAYRSPTVSSLLARWGASIRPAGQVEDDAPVNFETLYVSASQRAPSLTMAQINYDEDEVQLFFLGLVGVRDVALVEPLDANLEEIAAAVPAFRSYLMPGTDHGVIRSEAFFDMEVDGVSLVDWTDDIISGKGVRSVMCRSCVRPH